MTVPVGMRLVREYRLQVRRILSSDEKLNRAEIRHAQHPHIAVAPWLGGDPLDHIVPVLMLLQSVEGIFSFRVTRAARIGNHMHIAA